MQKANVAPLRGGALLAFRGAVIFSLLHLCFDMVEVGGSNPPGSNTHCPKNTHFFARWTLRALDDSQQGVLALRDLGNAFFKPFLFVDRG